ncbi:MAG TPA: DUF1178 family protein [Burkholderiaceae bacterium]|nr:DUF1178 family protein [Burkholderiaceae bacterium]
MKVLDLQCVHQHSFEGWFASEDDFQGQLARGMVECPLCGDSGITKKLSAPRLNLGAAKPASGEASDPDKAKQEVMAVPQDPATQAAWLKMVRHVMANTEDVGEKFAEEARRIHYGESEERGIRGQASRAETESLLEEGISVMPLPIPKALKGPLQ